MDFTSSTVTLIIPSVPVKTATTYKSLTTGSSPPERVVTIRHHLGTPFHNLLAYVASVSVQFSGKERGETDVFAGKDRAKSGASKRAVSRFISRAVKTCYAG